MTKIQHTNICIGTMLRNTENGFHYRLRERIGRTLLLIRVTPVMENQTSLVETVKPSQSRYWDLVN